jgi:hypothetical protein
MYIRESAGAPRDVDGLGYGFLNILAGDYASIGTLHDNIV